MRPSDSTAKWVSPRSMPITGRPAGSGHPAGLDHETSEVPPGRVLDHRHAGGSDGRARDQRTGTSPIFGQAQLPARSDLEPGVGGEPDRLPAVLAGPEPRRPIFGPFRLPRPRRRSSGTPRSGPLVPAGAPPRTPRQPCSLRAGLRRGQPRGHLRVGEVRHPGRMRLLPGAQPVVEHDPCASERPGERGALTRRRVEAVVYRSRILRSSLRFMAEYRTFALTGIVSLFNCSPSAGLGIRGIGEERGVTARRRALAGSSRRTAASVTSSGWTGRRSRRYLPRRPGAGRWPAGAAASSCRAPGRGCPPRCIQRLRCR